MTRKRRTGRRHNFTPKQRKQKRAAREAALPPKPSPEEIEAMRAEIKRKLDPIAAAMGRD